MKTFDTYEQVDGMKVCIKKPIPVQFKQINEPFRVNSLEGNFKQGKSGDYLMTGIDGEHHICDKEIFEKTYDVVDNLTETYVETVEVVNGCISPYWQLGFNYSSGYLKYFHKYEGKQVRITLQFFK